MCINSINQRLLVVRDSIERIILLARKSAYLARMGRLDDADRIIVDLRSGADIYSQPIVPVWLEFAEGVASFYKGLEQEAKDKWERAKALSKACEIKQMTALSSAWLAHLAFSRFDCIALGDELGDALGNATPRDADCMARALLVLGEASHLAGDRPMANLWYARSRAYARLIGDELTISSIIFNTAAMQIVIYRQHQMAMGLDNGFSALAVKEADSASNFDALVGVNSLAELTPILKAQAYSLVSRFAEAEKIYSDQLAIPPRKSQARSRCWLLADRAYCAAMLGSMESSIQLARNAVESITDDVQVDDLAAMHSRLWRVYELAGCRSDADHHRAESSRRWNQFARLQEQISEVCARFEAQFSAFDSSSSEVHGPLT